MAPLSPRKVPLAGGILEHTRSDAGPAQHTTITSRAFFCGVVVEGNERTDIPPDVQDLIASLGEHLPASTDTMPSSTPDPSLHQSSKPDPTALADVIHEFITTERSYLSRITMLKTAYADPLRNFARSNDSAIIPRYEAKTLFGNIDALVPVHAAFLADLEAHGEKRIGDVALKHFKILNAFECYKLYYSKREEAQAIFEREMGKKSGFASFVDKIKYNGADSRNRVGLRELLMDPIQRIPRYTLMWRLMITHMNLNDPQRAKLIEADSIASKIAMCEADEQTIRAGVMYCLSNSIEGFAANLISNGRKYIDCIDVEDGEGEETLHATLFLFDDTLVVAKRHNPTVGGKTLAGLDALDRSGGALLPIMGSVKKGSMSFKGAVDIMEVSATIVNPSSSLIHLYLSTVPQIEGSERWCRAFRSLNVVHPPRPPQIDPITSARDRKSFVEKLWMAQARIRERQGRSLVLFRPDEEVDDRKNHQETARVYWNVYERKPYLGEPKKPKVVFHIDPLGTADPIPFGVGGGPCVVIRVQPMAGELCRFSVTSTDPNDEGEEDIEQTPNIPSRVVRTIHEYGLYKFRTGGRTSQPSTPNASTRSRAALFGLDALSISKNLFNVRQNTIKGDLFGTASISKSSHKRTKSSSSRTTQTTSTEFRFSQRSNSTATMATSVDEDSFGARSRIPTRKLWKSRSKSPGGLFSGGESDGSPKRRSNRSPSRSRASSVEPESAYEDEDEDKGPSPFQQGVANSSDWELSERLELARRNSHNQHSARKELPKRPLEAQSSLDHTIYEAEEPPPMSILRPLSRASRATDDSDKTVRPTSAIPTPANGRSRSSSRHSGDRKPMGPRPPSPLPPRSPTLSAAEPPNLLDAAILNFGQELSLPVTPKNKPQIDNGSSAVKGRRLPFEPLENSQVDVTPKAPPQSDVGSSKAPHSVEPLSIKKKTSVRDSTTPSVARRTSTRARVSPSLSRTTPRASRSAPSHLTETQEADEPQVGKTSRKRTAPSEESDTEIPLTHALGLIRKTKDDLDSARRTVKRIKLDSEQVRTRPNSPVKDRMRGLQRTPTATGKSPHSKTLADQAAEARMEELRQMIGQRSGGSFTASRSAPTAAAENTVTNGDHATAEEQTPNVTVLAHDAEEALGRMQAYQDKLQADIELLAEKFREKSAQLEKARAELQSSKMQCELVKNLLTDATSEKEIMFEAFNEELDKMFDDAHLPESEAWEAMVQDLRKTKDARNESRKENSILKRSLAEAELQRDEWGALLRAHGLIP
ncbi:hypothetical protein SISNIDRAFT_456791 [Sistotremastrum niveocremeum HHB9708]|uniref:DH domain-containing protein n=1 Tax=Sistotremastrum niveocremeum HHB9708 TaxID=1314777 RepID=A0A164S6J3_9AGAM|nr:hypothetical protein SISNIDRAFT_456791 [Sistotremastrum niveocremeum HHB9708]